MPSRTKIYQRVYPKTSDLERFLSGNCISVYDGTYTRRDLSKSLGCDFPRIFDDARSWFVDNHVTNPEKSGMVFTTKISNEDPKFHRDIAEARKIGRRTMNFSSSENPYAGTIVLKDKFALPEGITELSEDTVTTFYASDNFPFTAKDSLAYHENKGLHVPKPGYIQARSGSVIEFDVNQPHSSASALQVPAFSPKLFFWANVDYCSNTI